ncbi:2,4-dienoyl-CoA reductase [Psychrosphaera saromensis]|uniref:2,4-dienoyl-CoA reductase n=1 Tax=Psychrosphaera saromensis TaxID=716813 RepID=A0A2S7UVV7_9GAMM|nr:NADH:flavin oxidoreductase/NADH oxidase family protein [Psychrosphaera saromensis]PQJ53642.1 2,4-dienoyl-CoA reductase [Psychrosphaera saromensis]GHB63580.1 2,4-dienoyl-CoA reductase [Psychrosphaera saromensis]GLQ15589.1 2,4-dienoyl-CoA reductase [Psychrosphaera saromensis]
MSLVFNSFTFPNSTSIKNRIVKAAMEENMSDENLLPSDELINLYGMWAKGGSGLLITGNVMVDKEAMTGPGGVVLDKDSELTRFKLWADTAKQNKTKVWMQISHPGRQVYKKMGGKVYSPSDIALNMGKLSDMFGHPTAMTEAQISDVISRFTDTAKQAELAGFDGVEVHAAHGYLLAQFLSPLVNQRDDQWGGSLDNRSRLLLEVIKAIKSNVSESFSISVKLNSADFQRGGFDEEDALAVVKSLEALNIDMIELSGGSYEAPAMQGVTADGRTLAREAYFLSFAASIAKNTSIPIMTTGGIYKFGTAKTVLAQGVDLVGIATALALQPDLPNGWLLGKNAEIAIPKVNWKNKTFRSLAIMALVKRNLRRVGAGKKASAKLSPLFTLILDQIRTAKLVKRYQKLMSQ